MPGIGMPGGGGTAVRVNPGSEIGASWERRVNQGPPLVDASIPAVSVFIQARPDNQGWVWVGDSGAGDGLGGAILQPGASIVINIDNANKLFIFGPTATDRVTCLVVR